MPAREKEPALILERIVSITLSHDFGEATLPDEYKPIRDFMDQSLAREDPTTIERYVGQARQLALVRAYISHEGYRMPCPMVSTPDRMNFSKVTNRTLVSDNEPDICKSCALYQGTF